MRRIILFAIALQVANCGSLVSVQQYPAAVVNYDSTYVPVVPARPALYSAPVVHTPYVGVQPVAHVRHNYHTQQTHPIVYQRPVSLKTKFS